MPGDFSEWGHLLVFPNSNEKIVSGQITSTASAAENDALVYLLTAKMINSDSETYKHVISSLANVLQYLNVG